MMNKEIEPVQTRRNFLAYILNRIRKQEKHKLLEAKPLEFFSWMAHEHKKAMIGTTAVITSVPLAIGVAVVFRHWLNNRSLGRIDKALADSVTANLLADATDPGRVLVEAREAADMMGGPEQLANEAIEVKNKLGDKADPFMVDALDTVEDVSRSSL